MKLIAEYLEQNNPEVVEATLAFLIRENEILLAMKKRGFGIGKWNGVGGKVQAGEKVEEAAKREAFEEIGVEIKEMKQVAIIDFYWIGNKAQQVTVFKVTGWNGNPIESDEMKPDWYDQNSLPFNEMWVDDEYWLPLILQGKEIEAGFLFSPENELLDHYITELDSAP